MRKDTKDLIEQYLAKFGDDNLVEKLQRELSPENEGSTLTIIANAGVHPVGELHRRGEVYIASTGNLDFSSKKNAENEIRKILLDASFKLKSRTWTKIYLVPFGPSVLSMLLKLLVYRVLSLETIDVLHAGNGAHLDIQIDTRTIAIGRERQQIEDDQ